MTDRELACQLAREAHACLLTGDWRGAIAASEHLRRLKHDTKFSAVLDAYLNAAKDLGPEELDRIHTQHATLFRELGSDGSHKPA